MTRITQFANLSLSLLLALAITAPSPIRVQAESQSPNNSQTIPTNWNNYEPDSNIGSPGRREGGASRGECVEFSDARKDKLEVKALIPNNLRGITTEQYPTFFAYVPKIKQGQEAELELAIGTKNEKNDFNAIYSYKTKLKATESPGIVSLSWPKSGNPGLQVNQSYLWRFTLICKQKPDEFVERTLDDYAEGLISRVEAGPTMKQQLEQATTQRDRAIAYARAGLWYDALNTFAELRRQNANDPTVARDWTEMLRSVGLEKLAQEPLLQPVAGATGETTPVSSDR